MLFKLFSIHNSEELLKGVTENPDKFNDPKYFKKFKQKLNNKEENLGISDEAYEQAIDGQVNTVDGFAHRFAQKTNNENIVSKIYDKITNIDKHAPHRLKETSDKRKARISQLKKAGIKFAIAGLSAAAITTLSATSSTLAAITGVGIGVGVTTFQIWQRKKQAKKEGRKYTWKDFTKDRELQAVIATTTLGASAVAFGVAGNPILAGICGKGALAIGMATGGIKSYKQSRDTGLGKGESVFWGSLNAIATFGGALVGRSLANSAIDSYNANHARNEIFQTKETVTHHTEEIIEHPAEYKDVIDYKPGVIDGNKHVLELWYKDHPDLLQERLDNINDFIKSNHLNDSGKTYNAYRILLAQHDSGMLAPDNMEMHVQGGHNTYSGGNHKVFGPGWVSDNSAVDASDVHKLASGDLDLDTIKSFDKIDPSIGAHNTVGHVDGAGYQDDGVLNYNARNVGGELTTETGNPNVYATYANHSDVFTTDQVLVKDAWTEIVTTDSTTDVFPANDRFTGIFGWLNGPVEKGKKRLRERLGSLADKIAKKKRNKILPEGKKALPEGEISDIPKRGLPPIKDILARQIIKNRGGSEEQQNYAKEILWIEEVLRKKKITQDIQEKTIKYLTGK
ncbi:MAG: hypothetical protein JXR30_03500 [Alphaproteobacteria bacterium]|nr:hypothetical protein [Alphaproteobacteria bacterium]